MRIVMMQLLTPRAQMVHKVYRKIRSALFLSLINKNAFSWVGFFAAFYWIFEKGLFSQSGLSFEVGFF